MSTISKMEMNVFKGLSIEDSANIALVLQNLNLNYIHSDIYRRKGTNRDTQHGLVE